MTAINGVVTESAVHLYSDGALLDMQNGNLVSLMNKVSIVPQLNCAIAVSGPVQVAIGLLGDLGRHGERYDDFKDWMRDEFSS